MGTDRERGLHEFADLVAGLGVDQRAHVGGLVQARVDLERTHRVGEPVGELLGDRGVHDEPVGGGAGRAAVSELDHHGPGHSLVEVCVGLHDEGCVAAKLHSRAHDRSRGVSEQHPADLGGTGEGDFAYQLVVQQRRRSAGP